MKGQFTNIIERGFSTIELLIALSLLAIIMVGAIASITSAQYWFVTAQIANEALYKNKILFFDIERLSKENFQQVLTSKAYASKEVDLPSDATCISGGQCYFIETQVTDISSCAKEVQASVRWKIAERYATSSVTASMYLPNVSEILAVGGDCLIERIHGDWHTNVPTLGSQTNLLTQGNTGIDVLDKHMYITSVTAPFFRMYKIPENPTHPLMFVGSSTVSGLRVNDVEVIRDYATGREYAYLMQHSSTSQLVVYEVTEPDTPTKLAELTLHNVASSGSFPQGWRVVAYGNQLFVVTRETTGPELHIFSIEDPRLPTEVTSAAINLNRTVNDMVIRDEIVNGSKRRFLYLAASSDLKEVGVYDVTGNIPVEVAAINLTGSADAVSIYLTGSILFVGRKSSAAPELYAFESQKMVRNELEVLGTAEVGAEVLSLQSTGSELIIGTGKNGAEFQIWNTDIQTWDPSIVNSGQLSSFSSSRLAPLGIDVGSNAVYVMGQSQTQPEMISALYIP